MKNKIRNLAVGLLILGFCLPGCGYLYASLTGADTVSETEKRMLTSIPTFDGSMRDFTAGMDDYFEDNFGFRLSLIRMARSLRDNLGENPPDVVYGKDGWLFLSQDTYIDEFEGRGRWTEQQVDDWIESLTEIKQALNSQDIPFVSAVAMDKARVYPEYLPHDWTPSPRRFRTALHAHSDGDKAGLLDVEPIVFEAKDRGELVYFRRDTHWTANAVYPVATRILDTLDPKRFRPRWAATEPVLRPYTEPTDLDGLMGNPPGLEPAFRNIGNPGVLDYSVTNIDPASGPGARDDMAPSIIVTDAGTDAPGTLVIVGDSFADRTIPHLKPSFDRIIRIYHGAQYYRVGIEDIMAFDPDAVLFLAIERNAVRMERPFAPLVTPDTPEP